MFSRRTFLKAASAVFGGVTGIFAKTPVTLPRSSAKPDRSIISIPRKLLASNQATEDPWTAYQKDKGKRAFFVTDYRGGQTEIVFDRYSDNFDMPYIDIQHPFSLSLVEDQMFGDLIRKSVPYRKNALTVTEANSCFRQTEQYDLLCANMLIHEKDRLSVFDQLLDSCHSLEIRSLIKDGLDSDRLWSANFVYHTIDSLRGRVIFLPDPEYVGAFESGQPILTADGWSNRIAMAIIYPYHCTQLIM